MRLTNRGGESNDTGCLTLLVLGIVLGLCISLTEGHCAEPAVPTLSVSPRLGLYPLTVRARLRIDNPGPELYCPKITWTFDQGRVSSGESDCPPWDELDEADRAKPVLDSKIQRYGPGKYTIRVRVEQGKRVIELSETVESLGGPE